MLACSTQMNLKYCEAPGLVQAGTDAFKECRIIKNSIIDGSFRYQSSNHPATDVCPSI